ncbi:MAG: DUF1622 domain-containing protein [Candidatus Omnitrophica bacterium]|nr:DUF1622 domain-containing protein [Candidatus Omnitrophota bacterium]MDD5352770.1 DUF1622 domain-containing protein [Candidatus Omnitrophota bacterium]MDD5550369.1 DUF1622 domain-containing protein [Candidatus Omnitrophota bacterium]
MDLFHSVVESFGFGLNVIGALITVWGVFLSLVEFLSKEISRQKDCLKYNEVIRMKLGSYLVLALEFFISGDIIKTIITPTWTGLGILGAIVVIRTILSYFLTKDLKKFYEKESR